MSFPRYPKYKESGVEWLGEVPEHWTVLPNKAFLNHSQSLVGDSWDTTQLLSLTLRGVIHRDIDSGHGKYPSDFGGYQNVAEGDLVFCLFDMDETPRTVGVARSHGMITSAYDVFRCKPNASPSFVDFYYQHIDAFKGLRPFYTGLRKVVRPPTFMAVKVALPPLHEQSAIAAFLDRETAKIDALVAEQRRLIELLAEKRQAVISHAVAHGLNPNVPMKPSGIKWLGEVPEHWQVVLLGRAISSAELGGDLPGSEAHDGIPLIKMGNLHRGNIQLDGLERLPIGMDVPEAALLRAGDFLFNTRNSFELVGKSSIWRNELPVATYNSNILRLKFKKELVSTADFMALFFGSDLGRSQLRLLAKGTTSVAAIYYKDLCTMVFLLPPSEEQHAILRYVNADCATVDNLAVEANRAIELLQERRTALISAAVTGKIDVRRFAEGVAA